MELLLVRGMCLMLCIVLTLAVGSGIPELRPASCRITRAGVELRAECHSSLGGVSSANLAAHRSEPCHSEYFWACEASVEATEPGGEKSKEGVRVYRGEFSEAMEVLQRIELNRTFECLQQAKDGGDDYDGVRQPERPWTRWDLQREYELLPPPRWGGALLGQALREVSLLSPVGVAALSAFPCAAAAAELVLQFLHRDSREELAGAKRPLVLVLALHTALSRTVGQLLLLRGGLRVVRTFQAGCLFVLVLPVGLHNLLVLLERSYWAAVEEHRHHREPSGKDTSDERLSTEITEPSLEESLCRPRGPAACAAAAAAAARFSTAGSGEGAPDWVGGATDDFPHYGGNAEIIS
jgi:hypothetical protein